MNTDNDSNLKKYTLTPTSGKTIKFTGCVIAEAGGQWRNGVQRNRWTELTIYRTQAGKYILWREYFTQWEGESNDFTAQVCADPKAVYDALLGESGELGPLDSELLRDAAKEDPAFESVVVEEIE